MTNTVHAPFIEFLAQQIIKASSKAEQIAINKPVRSTRLPACYVLTKQRLTKMRTQQHGA